MATDKEKYAAAKAYIREKKYDNARRLLKQIDHPAAKALLEKIPASKRFLSRRNLLIAAGVVVIVLLVAAVLINQAVTAANVTIRLSLYCSQNADDVTNCDQWIDTVKAQNRETITRCYQRYPESLNPLFVECLFDEGVTFPDF